MDVDPVRHERIRSSECPLCQVSDGAEIHVRTDHVIGTVTRYRGEIGHNELSGLGQTNERPCSGKFVPRPTATAVILSKEPDFVAELRQSLSHLSAERSDTAAETCKGWCPKVDSQEASASGWRTGSSWRAATGFGQRCQAQRQPNPAASPAAAPPIISTIEPFGCISATAGTK